MGLPDVQSWKPRSSFKLTRVGIKGIKKQVYIKRPEKTVQLIAEMEVFVDLPASKKGSDLSRNSEVIEEVVEQSVREPSSSLENLCGEMATRLLQKHEYATRSEVHASADYFLERFTPGKRKMMEPYRIISDVFATKGGNVRKFIGVEVMGMTACPCAMETIKEAYGKDVKMTHNQRSISTLVMESRGKVDADDLIDIAEMSMSSPTYEILKRSDEKDIVVQAHENPKFVEDVVRDMLANVLEKYGGLPDYIEVLARSESMESIHKHNAFAERKTTLGELRK
jgi:GTP cyclohydrolase IV